MLLRRTVGANFRRSTGGNRPANFVMAGLVPRAFTHGFSRLGKNAGTSSFRGAGSAREPGIQEHGREKSMARPVFMGSGPGPDRPSRNDTRVFQHPASPRNTTMGCFLQVPDWLSSRGKISPGQACAAARRNLLANL